MAVACANSLLDSHRERTRSDAEKPVNAMGYESIEARTERRWFALRTRPRHEKVAAIMLEHKGYECFLPLYKCKRRADRTKTVQLPIFPGYLFCNFDPIVRLPILTTPGVLHVVGVGRTPLPIDETELYGIRCLVSSNLPAEPWPYLQAGQQIYINDGPLQGMVGVLLAVKNRHRLVLSITLLRRSVAVEIEHEWVTPAALLHPRKLTDFGRP